VTASRIVAANRNHAHSSASPLPCGTLDHMRHRTTLDMTVGERLLCCGGFVVLTLLLMVAFGLLLCPYCRRWW
jgi:hypothetical protein